MLDLALEQAGFALVEPEQVLVDSALVELVLALIDSVLGELELALADSVLVELVLAPESSVLAELVLALVDSVLVAGIIQQQLSGQPCFLIVPILCLLGKFMSVA